MIKADGFYNNAYLHICSTCLRLGVSSQTEIHYCRLNQVKEEYITIELWCLKWFICMDSSDELGAFDGL